MASIQWLGNSLKARAPTIVINPTVPAPSATANGSSSVLGTPGARQILINASSSTVASVVNKGENADVHVDQSMYEAFQILPTQPNEAPPSVTSVMRVVANINPIYNTITVREWYLRRFRPFSFGIPIPWVRKVVSRAHSGSDIRGVSAIAEIVNAKWVILTKTAEAKAGQLSPPAGIGAALLTGKAVSPPVTLKFDTIYYLHAYTIGNAGSSAIGWRTGHLGGTNSSEVWNNAAGTNGGFPTVMLVAAPLNPPAGG